MTAELCQHGVVGIGSNALRSLRASLSDDLGIEAGVARLQEVGYAAGDELYRSFCDWLPSHTGVARPGELDTTALSDVLSEFFSALGWGSVRTERLGSRGLSVVAPNWAESVSDEKGGPSCYFSTGLLACFFTSLAEGSPLAVMELQCRAQGDAECQFLVGSPDTLTAVYEAASRGEDYAAVLGS